MSLAGGRAASTLGQMLAQVAQHYEQKKRQDRFDQLEMERHGWDRERVGEERAGRPLARALQQAQAMTGGVREGGAGTPLGDTGYTFDPLGAGTQFDTQNKAAEIRADRFAPAVAQNFGLDAENPEQMGRARSIALSRALGFDTSYQPESRGDLLRDRREVGGIDLGFQKQMEGVRHANAVDMEDRSFVHDYKLGNQAIQNRDTLLDESAQADADAAQAIQKYGSIENAMRESIVAQGRRGDLLRRRLREMAGRKGERDFLGIGAETDPMQILQQLRTQQQR